MTYIFDNSNLNESYAGVTTPLTFSFAQRVYQRVYRQFCQMMGVSKVEIDKNEKCFKNMLGLVGGRLYYNLGNWHEMIRLLPAYKMNAAFLEQMMGIESKNRGEISLPVYFKISALLSTMYISLRTVGLFVTMPVWYKRFNEQFNTKYDKYKKLLGGELSLAKLIEYYREAEEGLTRDFRIPIVNDFAVMVSTGLVKKMFGGGDKEKYFPLLLRAKVGVKSAQPGKMMAKLVAMIQTNNEYVKLFDINNSPEKVMGLLAKFPHLDQRIKEYQQDYGYRVPGELKLESLTFMNDKRLLVAFLQKQVVNEHLGDVDQKKTEASKEARVFPPIYLKWLLAWAENSITYREQSRFQRTLVFGLARDTFLKIGEILEREGWILDQRDIFYLTVEEVMRAEKIQECKKFKRLVARRKQEYARYQDISLPAHLVVKQYPVSVMRKTKKTTVGKQRVRGMVAANAGLNEIVGEALVMKKFDTSKNFHNKILVTRETDPGWTIIFPFVKGIVVERGGVLSHAAIVAREFNIPCIINAKEATELIPNRSRVKLNLKDGEVTWQKK